MKFQKEKSTQKARATYYKICNELEIPSESDISSSEMLASSSRFQNSVFSASIFGKLKQSIMNNKVQRRIKKKKKPF